MITSNRPLRALAFLFLLAVTVVLWGRPQAVHAADDAIYADLLARHVRGGLVDYQGLAEDNAKLDAYLDILAATAPSSLDRPARMAYWINVYNAWTLKLIVDHLPVKSIKNIGHFWSTPWSLRFVRLKDRTETLDYVEHEVLRPRFKDPRVHFAVNCASMGCPPLRAEPFAADRLDAQLDEQVRSFINDPARTRLDGDTLNVSKIFRWFEEDFGGEKGVVDFIRRYATGDLKVRLERLGDMVHLKYLDYDWSLNAVAR